MIIAVGSTFSSGSGTGQGNGGRSSLSAPVFEWSLDPAERVPKTIDFNVGTASTFPFTIYWGEGTETVVTGAGQQLINHSTPNGTFEIQFSAGAEVALEAVSGIDDVLSLSNIAVGDGSFQGYVGTFSAANSPKKILPALVDTFRMGRISATNYLPSSISSWDVSKVTNFSRTFFNNPAVDDRFGAWVFKNSAVVGPDTFNLMSNDDVASCLVQWNSAGQGTGVTIDSTFSDSTGSRSPRQLSESTYPAAKTAYDNLLSTYSWIDADAINWVA